MSKHLMAASLAAVCLSPLTAQSYFMPSNTPSTGTCNVIPFGTTNTSTTWANQKYQCMATQAELGNKVVGQISEIAFAPCGAGQGNYHFDTIEIVLAQTNQAQLSSTFASNLVQNPQVVLKATDYDWNVTGNQWNRIGLDKPYLYIAGNHPNLVIQLTMTGNHKTGSVGTGFHRDGTHQRVYHVGWSTTAGPNASGSSGNAALKFEVSFGVADLGTFGRGCTGSNGVPTMTMSGDGKPSGSVGVSVANCPNTLPVFHAFGLDRFPGPFDLGVIGAPQCNLYLPPLIILGGVTSATGVYSWTTAIPGTVPVGAKLLTQVFPIDPQANTWGRSASNYGRILVGN